MAWEKIKEGVTVTSGTTEAFTNNTLGKFAFKEAEEVIDCTGTWVAKTTIDPLTATEIEKLGTLSTTLPSELPAWAPNTFKKSTPMYKVDNDLGVSLHGAKFDGTQVRDYAIVMWESDYMSYRMYPFLTAGSTTITITGGDDVNNATLYDFLTTYFTKQA